MATPRQLDFSDDTSPSSPSLSRRKPPRKNTKILASPVSNRIWNEEDELTVLKGLVDYRSKTGLQPNSDWDAFYRFVGDSIFVKFSKEQVLSKISKLKRKFFVHMEKINQGNDPLFTRSTDSEAFGYSSMIWGKIIENETAGKESHDNDPDADELCALWDAFLETMMSQGLSDYQKKLQLDNLMNLGTGKRRELSNEWKALCAEEVKLNIKKLRFSTKLAEASNDI